MASCYLWKHDTERRHRYADRVSSCYPVCYTDHAKSTVMLFEFTIAEYHHIVIKKIPEARKIHLVNIDDNTILPYYQELRNSPLFVDITQYGENARYKSWLYNTCRRWRANNQPVIIFAPDYQVPCRQGFKIDIRCYAIL